jgi:carbamoyl-phosphate synthase / aspartate carbamoyltransferase
MSLSNTASITGPVRPITAGAAANFPADITPAPPVTAAHDDGEPEAVLEFADGSAFRGISFGAQGKSVAGECVFQTGAPFCSC